MSIKLATQVWCSSLNLSFFYYQIFFLVIEIFCENFKFLDNAREDCVEEFHCLLHFFSYKTSNIAARALKIYWNMWSYSPQIPHKFHVFSSNIAGFIVIWNIFNLLACCRHHMFFCSLSANSKLEVKFFSKNNDQNTKILALVNFPWSISYEESFVFRIFSVRDKFYMYRFKTSPENVARKIHRSS